MGLFGFGNKPQTTQQFGAPSLTAQQNQFGGMQQFGQPQQMGAMGMMQQSQNPMMQQAANDPVLATSQLLSMYDPVSAFIVTQNLPLMLDLIGEIVQLSLKEFFNNVQFTLTEEKLKLDAGSMPQNLATLSPETLALTLQKAQGAAQNVLNANQQQLQMFLAAHQQGMMMNNMNQNQPGFFGNLLGGIIGNQVQQNGGFGATMGQGVNMAAKGAAVGL